jgi:cadherin-like protein/Big-like domain-containing protein/K319-like protein
VIQTLQCMFKKALFKPMVFFLLIISCAVMNPLSVLGILPTSTPVVAPTPTPTMIPTMTPTMTPTPVPSSGDTHTYTLVSGTGDTDNSLFEIVGDQLKAKADLNYENRSSYSVRIRTTDSASATYEEQFTVTVTDANDPPTAANNAKTIFEETEIVFSAADFGFSDEDSGDVLSQVQITAVPGAGTLYKDVNASASYNTGEELSNNDVVTKAEIDASKLRFKPGVGTGTPFATFQFKVHDGTVYSTSAYTMTINVNESNDSPVLDNSGDPVLAAIDEDDVANAGSLVSAIITSLGGTGITDGDAGAVEGLAVIGVDNTNGTWQFNTGASWAAFETLSQATACLLASDANTKIRFVPSTNYNGTVNPAITFHAWDQVIGSNGSTADASVTGASTIFSANSETAAITVNAINDTPIVATNIGATVAEGGSVVIANTALNEGDIDDSGLGLTYTVMSGPANGQLELTSAAGASITSFTQQDIDNNLVKYVHDGSETTSGNFDFSLVDGGENSASTVSGTFTITVTPVNEVPTNIALTPAPNTVDENSTVAAPTWTISTTDPDTGDSHTYTLLDNAGGRFGVSADKIVVAGVLNYEANQSHTIIVRSTDSGNLYFDKSFTVGVNNVNDAPDAVNDSASTSMNAAVSTSVLINDTDEDGHTLSIISVTQGANGSVTFSGSQTTYTPNTDHSGSDSYTYTISDGNGLNDTATVSVEISDKVYVDAGTDQAADISDTVQLSAAVTGGDLSYIYSWIIMSGPNKDTAQLSDASISNPTFLPTQTGDYIIQITADDEQVLAATDTVQISVSNRPTVQDLSVTTDEDQSVAITFVGNDADGDTLTFQIETNPANGTVSGFNASNGSLTYSPNADYSGSDEIIYSASDGILQSVTGTVSITITPVDDPPFSSSFSVTTSEDKSINIRLKSTDKDGGANIYDIVSNPGYGRLTELQAYSGSVKYTPNRDYFGSDSFTYRMHDIDTGKISSTSVVSITVTPENDAPVALSQSLSTMMNSGITVTLTVIDVDANDSHTFTIVSQPSNGTLSALSSGNTLTYQPNVDFSGNDSFVFSVSDGSLQSEAGVSIFVDAPEPTPTVQPTATPTETVEPTATPTESVEPTATPTESVEPTATPTENVEPTATPTESVEPTATATVEPTATPTEIVEPTATSIATVEPTATSTVTPTIEPTATPTSTPISSKASVDAFQTETGLTIRWNLNFPGVNQDNIKDIHVYLQTAAGTGSGNANDFGSLSYIGRTNDPTATFLLWEPGIRLVNQIYRSGPQAGQAYHFSIFMLTKDGQPRVYGPFGTKDYVVFQPGTVEPSPTPENTPTLIPGVDPTSTPTATPTVEPTATQTPVPGLDTAGVDAIQGDKSLIIRWNLDFPGVDMNNVNDVHVYLQTADGAAFQNTNEIGSYYYLGHSGDSTSTYLIWEEGNPLLNANFSDGPQEGQTYRFCIFVLTTDGNPVFYGSFKTDSDITYQPVTQEPTPTPTSEIVPTSTPTLIPGVEATPTPTTTPTPTATPTEDPTSIPDLETPGVDVIQGDNSLIIRWNLDFPGVDMDNVKDIHVYVHTANRTQYLGRTGNSTSTYMVWESGNPEIVRQFRNGPEAGQTYQFRIYILTKNLSPIFYGPFENNTDVVFQP